MRYTTYQVAKMTGVTVRALRHYDKIGLLRPGNRSEAGYRLYNGEDLATLQQILFFKELDFPLCKIAEMMQSPGFDRKAALVMQMDFLEKRAQRYMELSQLARDTLAAMKGEKEMEEKELFEAFDYDRMMAQQKQYEDEVKQRWGNGDAYKISKQRTSKYTKADWENIMKANEPNIQELIACYKEQIPYTHTRMQTVVENARLLIDKNFYPCSKEMMSGLGSLYVTDERFQAYYDKLAPGLAVYYNQAIQHYCGKEEQTE